jgi:hypothetical protein
VAILILGFLALGWIGREPPAIRDGDDLTYLALSRSLESGTYREIFRANLPLHAQYPPVYPAWLAMMRHTIGEHLDAILAVNLVLVASAMLLYYFAARRIAGMGVALALLLLMAMNRGLLATGGSLRSEALFLFLSSAALAAVVRTDKSSRGNAVVVIGLAVLAFLTRSAGITLLFAVGGWVWSRRRRGELIAYAAITTLIVGGWFTYTTLAQHDQVALSYLNDLVGEGVKTPAGFLPQVVSRITRKAARYAAIELPYALSLPTLAGTRVDNYAWLGASAIFIIAGMAVLWRSWRVACTYMALYAGLLLAWPFAIGRLLVPIIPLAFMGFVLGARQLARHLPIKAQRSAFAALVVLLGFGAVRRASEHLVRYAKCDRANPYVSLGCYDARTLGLAAAADYIRQHAPSGEVVLTSKMSSVHFLSGHRTEPTLLAEQIPAGLAGRVLRNRGIGLVLLTSLFSYETGPVARTLQASCRELQLEASFPPHALLLRTSPPTRHAADACAALSEFSRENPERENHQ